MAKDLKDVWFSSVAARCNGADDEVIMLELGNAVRELFEHGLAWQEELGPYTAVAGEDLDLNTLQWLKDNEAIIGYVMAVRIGDFYIRPTTHHRPELGPVAPGSASSLYYCPAPNIIRFQPELSEDTSELYVRASVMPYHCTVEVPDFVATHYFEAVLDGALGRLFNYPQKPWSDAKTAAYHLRRFRNQMAKTRDIATRRFTRADPEFVSPASAWNSGFSGLFGGN